jgi:hypothetical protein
MRSGTQPDRQGHLIGADRPQNQIFDRNGITSNRQTSVRYARFPNAEQFIHTFLSPLYQPQLSLRQNEQNEHHFSTNGELSKYKLSQ